MNNLNYSTHLNACKSLMHSLIHEKATTQEIEEEKRKVIDLAKTLFSIQGDPSFQTLVKSFIQKISEVKPGRKLLSWLHEKGFSQIPIKKSEEKVGSYYDSKNKEILLHTNPYCYNGLVQGKIVAAKAPIEIILAHELIHLLHDDLQKATEKDNSYRLSLLNHMDNLEEQHTITGYNHDFVKKGTLIADLKLAGLDLSLKSPKGFSITVQEPLIIETPRDCDLENHAQIEVKKTDPTPQKEVLKAHWIVILAFSSILIFYCTDLPKTKTLATSLLITALTATYWQRCFKKTDHSKSKDIQRDELSKRPLENEFKSINGKKLEEIDVICENAFLFAWHLPPRVDHQESEESETREFDCFEIDSFYDWLKTKIHEVRTTPKEQEKYHKYVEDFLRDVQVVKTLPEQGLDKELFIIEHFQTLTIELEFPELFKNSNFWLKYIHRYPYAFYTLPTNLWKSKPFIIKVIKFHLQKNTWKFYEQRSRFYSYLDESLKNDPEIRKLLGLKKLKLKINRFKEKIISLEIKIKKIQREKFENPKASQFKGINISNLHKSLLLYKKQLKKAESNLQEFN